MEPTYFEKVSGTAVFDPDAAFKFIGVRAFIMSASTIADLLDDLYLVLGEKFVDARLYLGGRRAGQRTAAALVNAYKLNADDKSALEQFFRDFYAALGWAKLEFQLDYTNHGGFVLAHNSFLAQGAVAKFTARGAATVVESTKLTARCTMLSGYIAGLVTFLFGAEMDAKETVCLALGNPTCRFEITPKQTRET